MKIHIERLNKTFGERKIIDNLSYTFEDNRFYGICGESGCGKTTLLNVLSLILEADKGSLVFYDGVNYLEKNDAEKRNFRLENIGYVFQSFNLFNDDTVYNNVSLVLDSISNFSKDMRKRKVFETLKMLGVDNLAYKFIRDLSGGEKQRVAIARALVNNPDVIFADEPTGSVDTVNSELIFDSLNKISANCMVICVTHDIDLAMKYCDDVLILKDSVLNKVKTNVNLKTRKNKIMIDRKKKEKGEIHENFIFRHFINSIKTKKIRFAISSILLSISLFSLGLSLFLNEAITTSLKDSFSSIMSENSIVLKKKNESSEIIDYQSAPLNEINNIYGEYKSDIERIGSTYLVDFENFFIDQNYVLNISKANSNVLEGFNARSFNEFTYFKNFTELKEIYPSNVNNLADDEVIISMNYSVMKKQCQYLEIVRTFEALGEYILENNFNINLSLANKDWGYRDNISFRVKGVIPSTESRIYHNNKFFNEEVFEKKLMFPSSLNPKKTEEYPWIMKKVYYMKTKDFQTSLLNKIFLNTNYNNYIFDSDSYLYSPKTCRIDTLNYTNKVFVYKVYKNSLDFSLPLKLQKYSKKLDKYYYSTNSGYINMGSQLFSGFVRPTYFSIDLKNNNDVIDAATSLRANELAKLKLPNNTFEGSATKFSEDIVRFSTKIPKLNSGRLAENTTEILISKEFENKLGGECLGKELYVSSLFKSDESEYSYRNYFRTTKLKIVGIVDSSKLLIFQEPYFSLSLFRDIFQISSFDLSINSIVFELDEKMTDESINKINSSLVGVKFINPLDGFENGISETLNYLEYILIAITIVTLFASISLILIINFITLVETKRDYAILIALGYSNNELFKMQFINTFISSLISFVYSAVLIFLTSKLMGNIFTSQLGIMTTVSVKYETYLIMFISIIIISFINVIISMRPIKKIDIVKELH